jgi:hypothetical protein
MDARETKLRILLGDDLKSDAPALVAAGLDTPAKIKAASSRALLAVPGIGQVKLAALRERFPPAE